LLKDLNEVFDNFPNVKVAATKRAFQAQWAKSEKAKERNERLVECIQDEAKAQHRALSKGIKFAQLLRPGVRQRLGLEPHGAGWPSASSIKGAITKIKPARKAPTGQNLKK
jgi:hypothetical protein